PSRGRRGGLAMTGTVVRVAGPMVEARLAGVSLHDMVEVGSRRLPGEVLGVVDGYATIQVYEYTGGLRPGEPVAGTGAPLSAALGPGLIGGVFDGTLRPLSAAGRELLADRGAERD